MDGRGVKLGKMVKWVYGRKSTPGEPDLRRCRIGLSSSWISLLSSSLASDQIVFLVYLSGGRGLLFSKTQVLGWERS